MTTLPSPDIGPKETSPTAALTDFGLHCVRRPASKTVIVFVHGILSSGEHAWGKPSWPDLLANEREFEDAGILIFTYNTGVRSRTYSISNASSALLEYLRLADLKTMDRLVFVCHSMGGLVVRRLLVAYRKELAANDRQIGLFLVASPALGSRDASMLSVLSYALGHTQLAALRFSASNTWLDDLHYDFKTLLSNGSLRIEGRELIEDREITVKRWLGLRRQVVEPFAAAQYFHKRGCEPFKVPGSDHQSIAKPLQSQAIQHLMLKQFIMDFVIPVYNAALPPVDEIETRRAYDAIQHLGLKLAQVVGRPEALGKLQHALFQTRQYTEQRRQGEPRDVEVEERLASLWNDTSHALFKFDRELASLCWIKGHAWADERLWTDPHFQRLPIQLDDMLLRLHEATRKQVDDMPATLHDARNAFQAAHAVLNLSDDVVPAMARVLNRPLSDRPHSVTHKLANDGDAVEFTGFNQTAKVKVDDFVKLPAEDRQTIAAAEEGMKRLKAEFETIISKGRRSQQDENELTAISGQMGKVLKLILGVVETALGGPLQDHYAAYRHIAEYAVSQHEASQSRLD